MFLVLHVQQFFPVIISLQLYLGSQVSFFFIITTLANAVCSIQFFSTFSQIL